MSRLPRKELIAEGEVGIYHCVQRAVRRAFSWTSRQWRIAFLMVSGVMPWAVL